MVTQDVGDYVVVRGTSARVVKIFKLFDDASSVSSDGHHTCGMVNVYVINAGVYF